MHKMSLKQLAGPKDVRKYSEQNKTKETIQTKQNKAKTNPSVMEVFQRNTEDS